MSGKILIVVNEPELANMLFDSLIAADFKTDVAYNAVEGIEKIKKHKTSLVITDINLPGMVDLKLLSTIKNIHAELPVLLLTAYGSVSQAVSAIRNGAEDYLLKPVEHPELISKVKNLLQKSPQHNTQEFIAIDQSSLKMLDLAKKVAASDATVLVSGESGTGKEVLARYIHQHSDRSSGPFVAVNCAAIPETMLEATLFGYEKGAFTGAVQAHEGKFEQAQDGTLLLDEISEMDLGLQAKLLRVIQEKEVERIGGKKTISLDVRIIATTNRRLQEEVALGQFREDLFYRLNVFPLKWMPLRERQDDILPMARYLLRRHAKEMSVELPTLAKSAITRLCQYDWPGNIREMDNIMHRMVILHAGSDIQGEDLPLDLETKKTSNCNLKLQEYDIIVSTLESSHGNRKLASEKLGISPRTLRYKMAKMRELGIDIPPSVRST